MPENDPNNGGSNNGGNGGAGGAGTGSTGTWRDQLPETLRAHEAFTKYEKLGDLGNEFITLRGRVENSIPKLGPNATDAEKAAYRAALGVPEKADGYDITIPEGLPQDKETVDWFRATAHSLGLPKEAGEGIAKAYFGKMAADLAKVHGDISARQTKAVNDLKAEWKDGYQANLDLAINTAKKIGGEEFVKELDATRIGDNPQLIKVFHKIGTLISESAFHSGIPSKPQDIKRTEDGRPVLSFPSMEQK